jgi:hypothetical protein
MSALSAGSRWLSTSTRKPIGHATLACTRVRVSGCTVTQFLDSARAGVHQEEVQELPGSEQRLVGNDSGPAIGRWNPGGLTRFVIECLRGSFLAH